MLILNLIIDIISFISKIPFWTNLDQAAHIAKEYFFKMLILDTTLIFLNAIVDIIETSTITNVA